MAQTLYNDAKANSENPLQSESLTKFRGYLAHLDNGGNHGFVARFDVFTSYADKNTPDIENLLHQAQIRSAHGDNRIRKYGQYLESRSGEFQTTTNMAEVPPSRKLSLAGGALSLDAPIPV